MQLLHKLNSNLTNQNNLKQKPWQLASAEKIGHHSSLHVGHSPPPHSSLHTQVVIVDLILTLYMNPEGVLLTPTPVWR